MSLEILDTAEITDADGPAAAAEDEGPPTADRRALDRIAASRGEVRKARVEYEALADKAKASKKRLEARQEELESVIDDATSHEYLPLFDGPDLDGYPGEDATWREVPLSKLGLAESVLAAMAEQAPPLLTVGHLADWTKDGRNQLTDLRGVGAAKAEAIELAMDQFWARRSGDEPSPAS